MLAFDALKPAVSSKYSISMGWLGLGFASRLGRLGAGWASPASVNSAGWLAGLLLGLTGGFCWGLQGAFAGLAGSVSPSRHRWLTGNKKAPSR